MIIENSNNHRRSLQTRPNLVEDTYFDHNVLIGLPIGVFIVIAVQIYVQT